MCFGSVDSFWKTKRFDVRNDFVFSGNNLRVQIENCWKKHSKVKKKKKKYSDRWYMDGVWGGGRCHRRLSEAHIWCAAGRPPQSRAVRPLVVKNYTTHRWAAERHSAARPPATRDNSSWAEKAGEDCRFRVRAAHCNNSGAKWTKS